MPVPAALAHHPELLVGGELGLRAAEDPLVEGQVDLLPGTPVPVAMVQGEHHREGAEGGREIVGQSKALTNRLRVWKPRHVRQPGEGGCDPVEGPLVPVRTSLPVARDPKQDEPGVLLRQRLVAEAPLLQRAGAEVLREDVTPGRELAEDRLAAREPEVQRDRFLVAGFLEPEEGPALVPRAELAQEVPRGRLFHLDDRGPEFSEQGGRDRRPKNGGQVEHTDTGQGLRGRIQLVLLFSRVLPREPAGARPRSGSTMVPGGGIEPPRALPPKGSWAMAGIFYG